jgi:hypothetical protein
LGTPVDIVLWGDDADWGAPLGSNSGADLMFIVVNGRSSMFKGRAQAISAPL